MTRGLSASGMLLALLALMLITTSPISAQENDDVVPDALPKTDQTVDVVACACGCSIFDVGGTNWTVPVQPSGGSVWFRYAYMNQNQNWENSSPASPADNQDKQIVTSFFTIGGRYTFNKNWTVMAEAPFFDRILKTTDDGTVQGPAGSVYTANIFTQGDARLMGDYTGLSRDMSTGLEFGVKLPTGQWNSPTGPRGGTFFDRDSMPGTGSTDILLGAYHIGSVGYERKFPYWLQFNYSSAVAIQQDYRPGNELDLAAGLGYNMGPVLGADTTPSLQLLGSYRDHDSGINSDPLNSGYSRLLIAPGVEFRAGKYRVYTDVELPIVQRVNSAPSVLLEGTSGQLVAGQLYKMQVSRDF